MAAPAGFPEPPQWRWMLASMLAVLATVVVVHSTSLWLTPLEQPSTPQQPAVFPAAMEKMEHVLLSTPDVSMTHTLAGPALQSATRM